jgi:hypothetical protein
MVLMAARPDALVILLGPLVRAGPGRRPRGGPAVSARKDASAESSGLSVAPAGCAAASMAGGTG